MKIARYILPLLTGSLLPDYSYAEMCGKLRADITCMEGKTPCSDLRYKFDVQHQVDSCGNETAIYGFEVCNNSSSIVTFNGSGFKIRGTKITNGWPRKSNMMSNTCYKHRVRIEVNTCRGVIPWAMIWVCGTEIHNKLCKVYRSLFHKIKTCNIDVDMTCTVDSNNYDCKGISINPLQCGIEILAKIQTKV